MIVRARSQCVAEGGQPVDRQALAEWLLALPGNAEIEAVTHETGHQRDPVQVFVGLSAQWQEER